jgi:hypothetical protein
MKKFIIALCFCVGALHAHNVMANGENNGPKCNNRSCNETTNNVDNSTTNKAYGGDGGSAYSKAYGGNAKAYGGSAYQGQDQGQSQVGINSQTGIVKNVGPSVVITDQSVYEAQERDPVSSAYSHASHRYECVVGVGGGAQAANFGISISGGYESTLCNLGYVAKWLPKTDPRYAKLVGAMYDIAMDAAGYGPDTSTKRDPSVRDGR